MFGGVDKRPLAKGFKEIDAELRRVAPVIQEGGYVPMLDHSAPPDIPYENYRYFMEQLPKYL
jgi:uroporphyrinogen decarboxylase